MNAIATRDSAAGGVGAATSTALTNGPSSGASTRGGGPVAAPANQAYLGEQLLPAPIGEPQTIHLPDGSVLVPVARVDASGNRTPLSGGAGSAPLTGGGVVAPRSVAAPAAQSVPATQSASTAPAQSASATDGAFEPLGFLYNGEYYKRYFSAGGLDLNDQDKVKERAVESTFKYLLDREPEVDDFGVTDVQVRAVDPSADQDLLKVDPRAKYVIHVNGSQGNGTRRSIPTVINHDGATFTDPRLRGN